MPRWTWKVVLGIVAFLMVGISGTAVAQDGPSAAEEIASVPQGPDTSVQYVGQVDDSEIYVAVVDHGAGLLNIYLCDGEEVAIWLEGSSEEGTFAATAADGTEAAGEFGDAVARGTITLADGSELTFVAQLATLPAGLYSRFALEGDETVQARTIVLPNGTAKGKKRPYDCAAAEKSFETMMDWYRRESAAGSDAAVIYGNLAHGQYLSAQRAGCSWASGPTT